MSPHLWPGPASGTWHQWLVCPVRWPCWGSGCSVMSWGSTVASHHPNPMLFSVHRLGPGLRCWTTPRNTSWVLMASQSSLSREGHCRAGTDRGQACQGSIWLPGTVGGCLARGAEGSEDPPPCRLQRWRPLEFGAFMGTTGVGSIQWSPTCDQTLHPDLVDMSLDGERPDIGGAMGGAHWQ